MCSLGLAWRNEFRSCIVKDASERVNHAALLFGINDEKREQKKTREQQAQMFKVEKTKGGGSPKKGP